MPRQSAVARFENLGQQGLGLAVPLRADHPPVLGFDPRLAGHDLAGQHQHPLQHVERFEAGDHAGDRMLLGQRPVGLGADHRRDVGRAEVAVDLEFRIVGQHRHRCRHGLVGAQDQEVGQPLAPGVDHRPGDGRRGGFEADPEKDHALLGMFLGQGHRVEGRVDHLMLAPAACSRIRLLLEPGTRTMSPKVAMIVSGRRARATAWST